MAIPGQFDIALRTIASTSLLGVFLFLASSVFAYSQEQGEDEIPEIVSSDLERLDRRFVPEEKVRQQSGERQLVSALLFGTAEFASSKPNEMPWLTNEFELLLSAETNPGRICVDFSNEGGTFRATYLMKLVTNSGRVKLKVDYPKDRSLIGPGGTFVAYPALGRSTDVDDACDGSAIAILPESEVDEVVFPARVNMEKPVSRHLFIKLNSGGADVSVRALDVTEQEELGNADCYVPASSNGSYDRECRMDINYPVGPNVRFVVASIGAEGYRELTLQIPD